MPGHVVGESSLVQTKENVDLLTKLIGENDVVFLLMDSRESRWLPTLLGNHLNKVCFNCCNYYNTEFNWIENCIFLNYTFALNRIILKFIVSSWKTNVLLLFQIVINAALGFDTFVVMRHGIQKKSATTSEIPNTEGVKQINGENLGCYFCTDVTAPGNVNDSTF